MVEFSASEKESLFRVRFFYPGVPGHIVALAGVFNDWDPARDEMIYSDDQGGYSCELLLPAGLYEYKLVVDGQWLRDEGNNEFVSNDFGTLNSIVEVK